MPDDSKPKTLFAFLTRPLKKPEHQQHANEVLAEVLEDRQLQSRPRHFYKGLAVLWLLAALAVGLVWNHYRKPAFEISFMDFGGLLSLPIFETVPIGGETREDLWLFGLGEGSELEQKEKLLETDPDNPLYYWHYVSAYTQQHDEVPPDYFDVIARIDPDNAFWFFYAAGELKGKAFEWSEPIGDYEASREVDGVTYRPPDRPSRFEVTDASALAEAIDLIERGCALPENKRYMRQHIARVNEIHERINPKPTLFESIARMLQQFSTTSAALQIKKCADVLEAGLYQVAQSKDKAEFLRLEKLREDFVRKHSGKLDEMLIGALVYKALAAGSVPNLEYASRELGLEQKAAFYQRQNEQFNAMRNERRSRQRDNEDSWKLYPKMGILHQQSMPMLANQVASPPTIEDLGYKPLRLAEHEFVSQWLTMTLGLLLLLLTLPLFFARFVFRRPIRVSAIRAARLLEPADWLKVFGLGVLLPVVLHLLLTKFTFLGGRGFGIGGLGYAYPALPLLTLLISMWMASSIVIRRCLSERLPLPPASKRQMLTPWIYLGLALAIYVLGYVWMRTDISPHVGQAEPERFYVLLCLHAALLLLLAIWSLWIRVRGSHAERFRMLATVSALIPCIPVAVIALAVLLPIHLAGEKRWVAADDTITADASKPDYGLYEAIVARELYREVNAIVFPEEQ